VERTLVAGQEQIGSGWINRSVSVFAAQEKIM
jgi:hypothetical protein